MYQQTICIVIYTVIPSFAVFDICSYKAIKLYSNNDASFTNYPRYVVFIRLLCKCICLNNPEGDTMQDLSIVYRYSRPI